MKLIALIVLGFVCAMAQDISVQYAGTTEGAASWNPPVLPLDTPATCTTNTASLGYVSFNVTFPTAGVREIAAMAERNYKYSLRIYIYNGGFPTDPCAGLAHNIELAKQFEFTGGPVLDDFVYFGASTYTFVITGETSAEGGIFAVHVNPSTAMGQITGASPFWNIPNQDTTTASSACVESDSTYTSAFGYYSWTQGTTGTFDLFALFDNETSSEYEVDSYIALYQGYPSVAELSINPCNTTATFLSAASSYAAGVYIPYFNLTAGVNYTLVFSLEESHFAYWAVQIIPTRIRFFTPTGYIQPDRIHPSTSTSDEGCQSGTETSGSSPWGVTFFQAENQVYVIDTAEPPEPFSYVDTYSFLYEGANDDIPPHSCPIGVPLVLTGDTGDITPVFSYTNVGQNYTVVVSTYSQGYTVGALSAYVLYFFTGAPIGSIPSTTTGSLTTGSFATVTTGEFTATSTTGTVVTVGGTVAGPAVTLSRATTISTTTSTNSGSRVVASVALLALALSALL